MNDSVYQSSSRAGERVRDYLVREFKHADFKKEIRLPTNVELGRRLDVSPRTVHAVIQEFVQKGCIRAQRGSGTFLVSSLEGAPETMRIVATFPLVDLAELDQWLFQIGGGMFRAAMRSKPPVFLEGADLSVWGTDAVIDDLMAKREKAHGMIVLPYTVAPEHRYIIDAYEESGKPVVYINPPSIMATANFATPDFFHASERLGQMWLHAGRRRIVVLKHAARPNGNSLSATSYKLRHCGFVAGIGAELGKSISLDVLETNKSVTPEGGYMTMKRYLNSAATPPDAVFSLSNQVALGAIKALEEIGLSVPEEVSVIGGTALDSTTTVDFKLTTILQPLAELGEEVLNLLVRRIAMKGISLPGIVLPCGVRVGATTRADENQMLRELFPPDSSGVFHNLAKDGFSFAASL